MLVLKKKLRDALITDATFTAKVGWLFDGELLCATNAAIAPDRIGISVHLDASDRKYTIATECRVHVTSSGVQLYPTRSAALCPSQSAPWVEQTELARRLKTFLWTKDNWPIEPLPVVADPLGSWNPYMEILGKNFSVFSKSQRGRHSYRSPLGDIPDGYDLAVTASVGVTATAVQSGIAKANTRPEFNVSWHMKRGKLEGGPTFNPPVIDFVVGLYSKDEGGDIPATEWYLDAAGKALMRAQFISNGGGSGSFAIAQVGRLYDLSASFTWKYTRITFGVGHLPDFADKLFADFSNINLGSLDAIPVNVDGATRLTCEV